MKRDDVVERLRAVEPEVRSFGVGALFLFGSHARNEAGPASDVDVFVDPDAQTFYDLTNCMGAYRIICDAVDGLKVDYATRRSLSKYIRPVAEREANRVF